MMRGKSPPHEHNNINVTENYKYNQLRVSLNKYLKKEISLKKGFLDFFLNFTQNWQ